MSRSDFPYASRYCEENVWQLLRASDAPSAALFITNRDRCCALWHQRSAEAPGQPVYWDYHVVALELGPAPRLWDLDSDLPFPSRALGYLDATFPLAGKLPVQLEPRFRLVPEPLFTARFASDRSHMRAPDGTWLAPPPPWPLIATADEKMSLPRFIDLATPDLGEVLDLRELRERLGA